MRFVFFSFHYERDVGRANIVRNCWVTRDNKSEGFVDAASFEEIKKKGDDAVKNWIDDELLGTSVTVVLIGEETRDRKFVQYEIKKSIERGNGLLGIHIAKIKNQHGEDSDYGFDPFAQFDSELRNKNYNYPWIYYWHADDGYQNINSWIESAAKNRGK